MRMKEDNLSQKMDERKSLEKRGLRNTLILQNTREISKIP